MTTKEAAKLLKHPDRVLVLTALSYVNLTDRELQTLVLRHMRGHTQEYVAEQLECSVNSIQNWEKAALKKCCAVWEKFDILKEATQ